MVNKSLDIAMTTKAIEKMGWELIWCDERGAVAVDDGTLVIAVLRSLPSSEPGEVNLSPAELVTLAEISEPFAKLTAPKRTDLVTITTVGKTRLMRWSPGVELPEAN